MGLFDFLSSDPSKGAQKYLDKVPSTVKPYYDPYIQAGQRQLPGLEQQYGQLMNDPGGRMNEIGKGYQQSPGFQFALQQAMQGAGNAAAAGGMAGSAQHEQQNMGLATNLANQDYNQWLQNAMGMYGQGLQGSQGLYNQGANASDTLAQLLAGNLGSQASLGYAGGANRNSSIGGMLGTIGGIGGSIFGGPIGGALGGWLGNKLGNGGGGEMNAW
jgi:hypothetical protein